MSFQEFSDKSGSRLHKQYIYNSSLRLTFGYKIGSLKGAKVKKGKSAGGEEDSN